MSASSGLEQEVTEWLHEQATTDGSDQVLAAALGRAHGVRQERSGSHWLPTAHFFRPMVLTAWISPDRGPKVNRFSAWRISWSFGSFWLKMAAC